MERRHNKDCPYQGHECWNWGPLQGDCQKIHCRCPEQKTVPEKEEKKCIHVSCGERCYFLDNPPTQVTASSPDTEEWESELREIIGSIRGNAGDDVVIYDFMRTRFIPKSHIRQTGEAIRKVETEEASGCDCGGNSENNEKGAYNQGLDNLLSKLLNE